MQLPHIQISSQRGQIAIQTQTSVQRMEQPKAQQSISQPTATLNIQSTPAKLTIDQTKAWEEMNLKHVFVLNREAAQKGKQAAVQATARIAQEGDELMKIEQKGSPIASQAKRNSEGPEPQFNIGWVPSPGSVKVYVSQGDVKIRFRAKPVKHDTQAQKVIHDYQPGKVTTAMQQRPSLTIEVQNLK